MRYKDNTGIYIYDHLFGHTDSVWDYLPMAVVILCWRSQVRTSAVAL